MNNIDSKWVNFGGSVGTRLLLTTAFSPFEYAKTLIQIGFEPLPPKPTTTLLGKPALGLPNVFTYVKYIHSIDGTVGCFRGLTPRLCSTLLSTVSHSYVIDKFKIPESAIDERELTEEDRQTLFAKTLSREILATTTAIVISQPFHVIAVRMMGQFVGREVKYDGVFSSLWNIFSEEGFWGLFSGLTPRLIGEITTVFMVSSATFAINTYLVPEDKSLQQMFGVGVDFLVKNITYPFHVVGACMTINSSGLKAGSPPLMPNYSRDWMACWRDLKEANQLKRGSGLIWRYYIPPKTVTSGSVLTPMPKISMKE